MQGAASGTEGAAPDTGTLASAGACAEEGIYEYIICNKNVYLYRRTSAGAEEGIYEGIIFKKCRCINIIQV